MNAIAEYLGHEASSRAKRGGQESHTLQILHDVLARIFRRQHTPRLFGWEWTIRSDDNEIERFQNVAAMINYLTVPRTVAANPPRNDESSAKRCRNVIGMMLYRGSFAKDFGALDSAACEFRSYQYSRHNRRRARSQPDADWYLILNFNPRSGNHLRCRARNFSDRTHDKILIVRGNAILIHSAITHFESSRRARLRRNAQMKI